MTDPAKHILAWEKEWQSLVKSYWYFDKRPKNTLWQRTKNWLRDWDTTTARQISESGFLPWNVKHNEVWRSQLNQWRTKALYLIRLCMPCSGQKQISLMLKMCCLWLQSIFRTNFGQVNFIYIVNQEFKKIFPTLTGHRTEHISPGENLCRHAPLPNKSVLSYPVSLSRVSSLPLNMSPAACSASLLWVDWAFLHKDREADHCHNFPSS